MIKKYLLLLFLVIIPLLSSAQQEVSIIPAPQNCKLGDGYFNLSGNNKLFADRPFENELHFLQKELLRYRGITTAISCEDKKATILLKKADCQNCLYQIEVNQHRITISSNSDQGIFYGVVSLLQLVNNAKTVEQSLQIPCITVKDFPEMGWRGLMLDESRHFFGKVKVKSILDWMAYYKLNWFHWHLTDEPGWRIEIKKYPKLALVGGVGTFTNASSPSQYYTQEDIKEIVAYAKERKIEIIPEIDMPGHATAANRAYPEFSGGGSEKHPEFTFNPAKEGTYQYLTNILKEVNVLFPSQMIHLGGDEVSFGIERWKADSSIQQLMKIKKLADLKAVENYFMQRMADSLIYLNAKVLAWDEMAEVDLPRNRSIIFWWRHDNPGQLKKSLENGYQTVVCPRLPFYFDFVQKDDHRFGRKWAGGFNDLQSVYDFSISKLSIDSKYLLQILGVQANIWTETIINEQRLDYLMFPRIAALAETSWSSAKGKNYDNFLLRLKPHIELYKQQRIYYFDPFEPGNHPEPVLW
ncbi:MAG: beta-hexosaminidase [Bacteroidales bacterium]|nr:MAG: beta-hexosaminidase [Bacteroidales bacterium]